MSKDVPRYGESGAAHREDRARDNVAARLVSSGAKPDEARRMASESIERTAKRGGKA